MLAELSRATTAAGQVRKSRAGQPESRQGSWHLSGRALRPHPPAVTNSLVDGIKRAATIDVVPIPNDPSSLWMGFNSSLAKRALAATASWQCGAVPSNPPLNRLAVRAAIGLSGGEWGAGCCPQSPPSCNPSTPLYRYAPSSSTAHTTNALSFPLNTRPGKLASQPGRLYWRDEPRPTRGAHASCSVRRDVPLPGRGPCCGHHPHQRSGERACLHTQCQRHPASALGPGSTAMGWLGFATVVCLRL